MSNWESMRKFHNIIKISLINDYAGQSLFDVSMGRGGDIQKWHRSDIHRVVGIDPNEKFIGEAIKRFKRSNIKRPYTFLTDTITNDTVNVKGVYDTTSCQFTLHYFFESDKMLENAIRNISERTKKWFVGTTIIGSRLKKLGTCNNHSYEIILNENDYIFSLKDTDKSGNYFNEEVLREYYVDFDKFEKMCNKYNMFLIKRESFKDFRETLGNVSLSQHEEEISNLYDMFVFEKKNIDN